MREIKDPKKNIFYYYAIAMAVIILLNTAKAMA